jgi:hypothetical protein
MRPAASLAVTVGVVSGLASARPDPRLDLQFSYDGLNTGGGVGILVYNASTRNLNRRLCKQDVSGSLLILDDLERGG